MNSRDKVRFVVGIVFCCFVSIILSSAEGQVIYISNITDLQKIGNDPGYPMNGEYELTQDIDASGTQTWNSGAGFNPIGTSTNPFVGTFDGKGYKITGLYVNRSSMDNVGLFGFVGAGGEILNVELVNPNIKGRSNTGALVGQMFVDKSTTYKHARVINCKVKNGQVVGNGDRTGLLVGWSWCHRGLLIDNCSTSGSILGVNFVGGVVGDNGDGTVRGCFSTANVTGSGGEVGGIVGRNAGGLVYKCYATGGQIKGSYYVAGLVGNSFNDIVSAEIFNCYVENIKVESTRNTDLSLSGVLVGSNYGGSVLYCYSIGEISARHGSVGGLVGLNKGLIGYCWASSIVNATEDQDFGGLVGWNGGIIRYCYVNGETDKYVQGINDVGGLVGDNDGSVENCYAAIMVSGNGGVGGCIGYNEDAIAKVMNCYSIGVVSGSSSVGGFCGANGGSVQYCYWDINTSGMSLSPGGGIGRTTALMKKKNSYTNWDFTSVWGIEEDLSYPYLNNMALPEIIEIDTINELQKIGNEPEYPSFYNYALSGNIDASSTSSWNSGAGFIPLCSMNMPFLGKFDGRGYKITGLYINRSGEDWVGLFRVISSGSEIINLGMESVNIKGRHKVGGIVGEIANGERGRLITRISNCYVKGIVTGSGDGSGLVAGLNGLCRGAVIEDCYAEGTVSGVNIVGGLLGDNGFATVRNCYTMTNVTSTGTTTAEVGGLIGRNYYGRVENSYSSGGVIKGVKFVGGLIGFCYNSSEIKKCYAENSVIATGTDSSPIGGLIGIIDGRAYITYVWDCYTYGDVSSSGGDIGGLIGHLNKGNVERCFSETSVSSTGYENVGGLIGYCRNSDVRGCYALGAVSGLKDVGGLIGQNSDTGANNTVINCYARGSVGVTGATQVGGLIGNNVSGGNVSYVYSTGNVIGSSVLGGLVGINTGIVDNTSSFWDKDTSGRATSAGGTDKTTVQMKQQNTYIDWDFTNVWGIKNGIDYPYLKWRYVVLDVSGMDVTQAEDVLYNWGFIVIGSSNLCSDVVPEGYVVSTVPPAGTILEPGASVEIVISTGPCLQLVTVPNVVGLSQSSAESSITGAGLKVGMVSQQCDNNVSVGNVISQKPTAGTQVSPGSAVDIVVSSGPCSEGVEEGTPEGVEEGTPEGVSEGEGVVEGTPEGVSEGEGVVEGTLEGVSEGEGVVEGTLEGVSEGEGVVEGTPEGVSEGEGVVEGTPEGVSEGEGVVEGTLEGVPEGEGVVEGTPEGVSEGEGVVEGTPEGVSEGEGVVEGTPEGEGEGSVELVTVPNVKNMSQVEATNELIRVGLSVGNLSQRCDDKVPQGKVVSQTPTAGTQVSRGSSVDLVISTGPCPVIVPDVVGRTEAQARGALEAAGLVFSPSYECSGTVETGKVIRQNPLGNTGVSSGTTVTVWVSTGPCGMEVEEYRGIWAYAGVDHIYVFWEGSVEAGLLGYRLYRGEKESGPWQVIAGVNEYYQETSYRDYNIELGKVYWYKVEITTQVGKVTTLGPVRVEMGRIVLWIPELEWKVGMDKYLHVPVNVENAMGLKPSYMNIDVSYNSAIMVPRAVDVAGGKHPVEKTAVSQRMQVYYNVSQEGLVKIGLAPRDVNSEEDVLYGEGHLIDLVFELKGGVSEEAVSEMKFMENALFDKEGNPVSVEVRGGKVVVRSNCMRGDMNGDGKVYMVDAGLLLKRLAKRDWSKDEYPCLLKRGDMNGDGVLDVADVSMLMRWSVGLPVNPVQEDVEGQKGWMKLIGEDTEVKVLSGSPTGSEMSSYGVGIDLSSLGGLAGVDMVLSYSGGMSYQGMQVGEKLSKFQKEVETGEGYIRLSLGSQDAIAEDAGGRLLTMQFGVSGAVGDKKEERLVQVREVRLKGVYGDDFRWYGEVKRVDGVIVVCPAVKEMQGMSYEQATQWLIGAGYLPDKREESRLDVAVGSVIGTEPGSGTVLSAGSKVVVLVSKGGTKEQLEVELKSKFTEVDSNGDGYVSWVEASGRYPGLTQEVFNEVDGDGDGSISKQEAGIEVGEGVSEGEGGGREETKEGCGCLGSKSLGRDRLWKYMLDFLLWNLLIFTMMGMKKKKNN